MCARSCAAVRPCERAARVGAPRRRHRAGERGDERHAVGAGRCRRGERVELGVARQAEQARRPAHGAAGEPARVLDEVRAGRIRVGLDHRLGERAPGSRGRARAGVEHRRAASAPTTSAVPSATAIGPARRRRRRAASRSHRRCRPRPACPSAGRRARAASVSVPAIARRRRDRAAARAGRSRTRASSSGDHVPAARSNSIVVDACAGSSTATPVSALDEVADRLVEARGARRRARAASAIFGAMWLASATWPVIASTRAGSTRALGGRAPVLPDQRGMQRRAVARRPRRSRRAGRRSRARRRRRRRAAPRRARRAIAGASAASHARGSCSAQPGRGIRASRSATLCAPSTASRSSQTTALRLCVPRSMPTTSTTRRCYQEVVNFFGHAAVASWQSPAPGARARRDAARLRDDVPRAARRARGRRRRRAASRSTTRPTPRSTTCPRCSALMRELDERLDRARLRARAAARRRPHRRRAAARRRARRRAPRIATPTSPGSRTIRRRALARRRRRRALRDRCSPGCARTACPTICAARTRSRSGCTRMLAHRPLLAPSPTDLAAIERALVELPAARRGRGRHDRAARCAALDAVHTDAIRVVRPCRWKSGGSRRARLVGDSSRARVHVELEPLAVRREPITAPARHRDARRRAAPRGRAGRPTCSPSAWSSRTSADRRPRGPSAGPRAAPRRGTRARRRARSRRRAG